MPTPPLPASNVVRVRLDYNLNSAGEGGSRFFIGFTGAAPTGANCVTLGTDIANAWSTNLAELVHPDWGLQRVDVQDISTRSGAFGTVTASANGTYSGGLMPANVATNVEYNITRRYRGGKPRMFIPPPSDNALLDQAHFTPAYLATVNTQFQAFINAIEALSVGSMGTLSHVNVSFYEGYNTATPPWRGPGYKYPPKYRETALVDTIVGYSAKAVVGSQRRRRTATTP